jgi:dUTP pyrophosphatase
MIDVQILTLPHGRGLALPGQASAEAAGFDIAAAEELTIAPGSVAAVGTGFALAIPAGFEGQVRPRSGLALKHGVTVLNAPGTIDADYRGEVKVILVNHGPEPFRVARGDRIAQLVVAPVTRARFESVTVLPQSERGPGGFGSTGVAARKGA